MKKILYIFLTLLSVQVSAQIEQPRVKLNQIIKDTMPGRFLMSSFVDSNMTYESLLATDGNLLYFKNQPYVSGGVNSIEYVFEASSNISQGQAVAINTDGKVSSVITSDRTVITDSDLDLFMLSKNIPSTANHIIDLSTAYKYTSLDWTNKMINISGRLGIVARNPDTVGYLNILDFDGVLESSNFITSSLIKDEFTQYGLVSKESERNISIIPLDTVNNPSTSYTNNKWLALYKNGVGRTYTQLNKNSSNGWPAFSGIEYPILQYVISNGSPAILVTHYNIGAGTFSSNSYPTYYTNIHKLNGNKLIATLFEANNIKSEESVRVVQGTIISNTVSDSIHWDSWFNFYTESPPFIDIENMNPSRGHSVYVPDENKVTIVSVVETGSLVNVVANIVAKTVYIQADTFVQTNLDTLLEIYSFDNLNINVGSFKDKIVVVKSTVGNPALAEYFQDFYVFTLNNGVITAPTNYTRVGPYTAPSKNVQMVYDYQINKLIVGIDNGLFAGTYNASTGTLIFGPTTYTDYNIDEITFNYNKDNSDYTRIAVLHADEKKIGLYDVSLSNIYNFIGFSKDSIPKGSLGTVTLLGGVNTYQDSLSPGRSYYINTEGNLQLDYSISGVVGKALTDTSILVTYIGIGNPNYIDENINIVDINPITNILTNETTPLTATRTTNTTTLDITEATSTTDGYITSEYKVQLDNLLSNSYLDTIITDNTLLYTEISTDTVSLKVDTTVISTIKGLSDSLANFTTGLWKNSTDYVNLIDSLTPIKISNVQDDSINISDNISGGIVYPLFGSTIPVKSGMLFYDPADFLSVTVAPPNVGTLVGSKGVLKYVSPDWTEFNQQYSSYDFETITSKWYVDNAIQQTKNAILFNDLVQETGIVLTTVGSTREISADTTVLVTTKALNDSLANLQLTGTTSSINQETFISDGIQSSYTTTLDLPTDVSNIIVTHNGLTLDDGLFTLTAPKTINLGYVPDASSRITIMWFSDVVTVNNTGTGVYQQQFTSDGIDSAYTINNVLPSNSKDVIVLQNGVVLDNTFFTVLDSTVTLNFLPPADDKITVIYFTGYNSITGDITQTGGDVNFDNGTLFIDDSLNNVGIGTTTPTVPLEIPGYIYQPSIRAGTINLQSYAINNAFITDNLYYNSNNGTFEYVDNGFGSALYFNDKGLNLTTAPNNTSGSGAAVTLTTVLTAATSGNVGIGTSSPSRELHITSNTGAQIKLESTTTGNWNGIDLSAGNGTYSGYFGILDNDGRFFIDNGSNGDDFTILQNGNVGIGTTSPTTKLDVNGETRIGSSRRTIIGGALGTNYIQGSSGGWGLSWSALGSLGTDKGGYGWYGNNDNLYYYWIGPSTFSPHMVILDNGNVSIGTTSSSYKLRVNGSVAGVGGYVNLSDEFYKKNVYDINYGINELKQLRPVRFNWINPDYGTRTNLGFIAQEVELVMPEVVITANDGVKSMASTDLIPVLTKAVQEQQDQIDQLQQQIQLLIAEINTLKNN